MEIIGPFIQEIIAIAGYVMVFAGVYKLYQVATDIREIKEAIHRAQRSGGQHDAVAPAPGIVSRVPDPSIDAADSYAENLLRAVNAESRPERNPVETGTPRP